MNTFKTLLLMPPIAYGIYTLYNMMDTILILLPYLLIVYVTYTLYTWTSEVKKEIAFKKEMQNIHETNDEMDRTMCDTTMLNLKDELKTTKNMIEELKRILESKNQMIATLERKRNELIKKTEETDVTLAFIRTLLKSMEFKVSNPVCPEYTSLCGKQIKLEEMTQHLMDCQHLHNISQKILLNTDKELCWDKENFNLNNKPVVFELADTKQYFILQGISENSTTFSFFMMHHSEEDMSGQYLARLEIYGETKNITRTKMLRCAPIGIGLKDARSQLYTMDISHEDLEKICLRENPSNEKSKFRVYIKFSVMVIEPIKRNDNIADRCAMQ